MTEWDHAATRTVDEVMGAFFFMRRSAFERLGGFDERFFVYFEEVDFSLRAREAGWRTVYLADAQAFHLGGGVSDQVKAHRLAYSLHSRLLYVVKHFSTLDSSMVAAATLLIEPWTRLAWAALRLAPREIGETLGGFFLLWRRLSRWPWTSSARWKQRVPEMHGNKPMTETIRILGCARLNHLGASTRYRLTQYLPYLRQEGFQVEVAPLLDDQYLRVRYSTGIVRRCVRCKPTSVALAKSGSGHDMICFGCIRRPSLGFPAG